MFRWLRRRLPKTLQHWLRKPRPRQAILYTRAGCHLCDVAAEMLHAEGYATQIIDIDDDPELRSRFDHDVPVVEIAGRIRFRGHVDPLLLRRLP